MLILRVNLKIIILILVFNCSLAQSYEKDWQALYAIQESGKQPGTPELEAFITRYGKQLAGNPGRATELYSLLGHAYYNRGLYEASEQNYRLSYNHSLKAQDSSLKPQAELNLAVFYYTTGRLLEAETYYLSCMTGIAAVYGQSSREYTGIFYDYTRLLIDLGKYQAADPYVDALLYYYRTLDGEKNTRYQGLLNCKAIIFQNTGRYTEAVALYETVVRSGDLLALGDTLGHVISISNLGDVYRETGQYRPAISYLKQAEQLYADHRLDQPGTLATIQNNLGLCYKSTDELQLAEQAYNQALRLYEQGGGTRSEFYCSTLSNKADLLRILGRYGEASELLLQALQIRRAYFGEQTENYANALSNLANVYFDAGSYVDKMYFREALEKNLEAERIYRETVGTAHQSYGNCMNNLSLCYLEFRDYARAESCKLKALEIIEQSVGRDHYRYAAYLISTYGLYKTIGRPEQAEKNILEAQALVERNFGRDHELYAHAELALAEIYTYSERFEAAAPLYRHCLSYYAGQIDGYFDAMSEPDQMSFLNAISAAFGSYNLYVILYRQKHPAKDLSAHLKLTLDYQVLLKSLLASKSAKVRREVAASSDEELRQIYHEWQSLKYELINTYKSLSAASEDNNNNMLLKRISELEVQLKARLSHFGKDTPLSFEQLKAGLKADEAVVEIFRTREAKHDSLPEVSYGALVVRKNSLAPELVVYAAGGEMDGPGFTHYSGCIDEERSDTLSYRRYFGPLEKALRGVRRLYVSADGVFHKISWPGLYDPVHRRYLADSYEVCLISNPAALPDSSPRPVSGSGASLFGYPDYEYDFKRAKVSASPEGTLLAAKRFGLSNLSKLPGTKTEVEEIARELQARNWTVEVFTHERASEAKLRALRSPRVLHIATHGFYLKDIDSDDKLFLGFENATIRQNPLLRSGLILAGAGPATEDSTHTEAADDGILTAYEASFLSLDQTELVVLSACQTGLGDDVGTEGVAGLQRSLVIAGARYVMMSLWPVDDYATQYLMTRFYKHYAAAQPVEQAFRTAQKEVREKYPHPAYWAAFVLLKTFN